MRSPLPIVVALVALALTAAAVPTATADAEGQLGLSDDGVHYVDGLTRPLFDPGVRWVPGDERTVRFWVRNQSPGVADLAVGLRGSRRDALLDTGDLEVAARIGDREYRSVNAPPPVDGAVRLVDREDVPPGTELPVDVRVRLDPAAPSTTMVLAADLDLSVTLSESVVLPDDGADPGDGGGADLPGTGTDVPGWVAPTAALLIVAGALVARRRRDDQGDLP